MSVHSITVISSLARAFGTEKYIRIFQYQMPQIYQNIYKIHTVRLSSHQKMLQQQQCICESKYVLGFRMVFNFLFVPPCEENKYARPKIQISFAVELI